MRVQTSALLVASVVALAAAGGAPAARAQQAHDLSRQDRTFAEHAIAGGMMEVQLGKLAQDHAGSQPVRAFGERMVRDHRANTRELIAVAKPLGVTPPTTLPAEQQHQIDKLSALYGPQFDNTYMAMMVQDHQNDIRDYHKEVQDGKNSALRKYAQQTLPILQEHLALAEDLARPQGAQLPPNH